MNRESIPEQENKIDKLKNDNKMYIHFTKEAKYTIKIDSMMKNDEITIRKALQNSKPVNAAVKNTLKQYQKLCNKDFKLTNNITNGDAIQIWQNFKKIKKLLKN